jgi:hypothetical protein
MGTAGTHAYEPAHAVSMQFLVAHGIPLEAAVELALEVIDPVLVVVEAVDVVVPPIPEVVEAFPVLVEPDGFPLWVDVVADEPPAPVSPLKEY